MDRQRDIDGNDTTNEVTTRIVANCTKATTKIYLHAANIKINRVDIFWVGGRTQLPSPEIIYNPKNETILLREDHDLLPGETYDITIESEGNISNTISKGIFFQEANVTFQPNETYNLSIMATSMELTGARRVYPCLDEPSIKVPYEISLEHPPGTVPLSNTPVAHSVLNNQTNVQVTHFESTNAMSSHLVFVGILRGFETNFVQNTRIYAPPWLSNFLNDTSNITNELIMYYSKLLNSSVINELTLVIYPHHEWTSVVAQNVVLLAAEDAIIVRDGKDKRFEKSAILLNDAVAQQYFGAHVTSRWWDSYWITRSLSKMYFTRAMSHLELTSSTDISDYCALKQLSAMDVEQRTTFSSLVSFVEKVIVDRLSLSTIETNIAAWETKGIAVLHLIENLIGRSTFKGIIRLLVQQPRLIDNDLFVKMISDFSNTTYNVSAALYNWTQQTGYPMVTIGITRNNRTNTVIYNATQRPICHSDDLSCQRSLPIWTLPLCIQTKHIQDTEWMTERYHEIALPAGNVSWLIAGGHRCGYYRVNYEKPLMKQLIAQLHHNPKQIPHSNRLKILTDAYFMAEEAVLDYKLFLSLTTYLVKETHSDVWQFYVKFATELDERLELTNAKDLWMNYNRILVNRTLGNLGNNVSSTLNTTLQHLACRNAAVWCIKEGADLIAEIVHDRTVDFSATHLVDAKLCASIAYGNEQNFDDLYQYYLTGNNSRPFDRVSRTLRALACATGQKQILKLLDGAKNSSRLVPVINLIRMGFSKTLLFDYLQTRWMNVLLGKEKVALTPEEILSVVELCTVGTIKTKEQLKQGEKLHMIVFEQNPTLRNSFLKGLYVARDHNVWQMQHLSDIEYWLKSNSPF